MLMFVKETLQLIEIDADEQAESNTEQCLWTNKWWVLVASVKSCSLRHCQATVTAIHHSRALITHTGFIS